MAERRRSLASRRMRAPGPLASALLITGVLIAGLVLPGATALGAKVAATPLVGWLGNGTTFPNRALVLLPPAGTKLTSANVHVTENGVTTGPLTVTPGTQAEAGDLGVMVVLDQSTTMAGTPLRAAVSAMRSLAATRAAQQQLGLVIFDGTPNVFLHPTNDAQTINHALSSSIWTGTGANVPAATSLALSQLAQAKVALGAIIVVSDGVGNLSSAGGPAPAAVQAAAAAAHVPVFTVGLQDRSATAASLQALSKVSAGQFLQTVPSRLTAVLKEIYATVTRGYVVRWRSRVPAGTSVKISAGAQGVPGAVDVGYQAPGALAVKHAAAPPASHRPARLTPSLSGSTALSKLPSFAVPAGNSAAATVDHPPARASANGSFWASPAAVAIVAGICGLLFALSLVFALYRPSQRAVRTRVGSFIPGHVEPEEGFSSVAAPREKGLLRSLERGTWWPPFVENVEIGGNPHTPSYLVKRAAAIGVVLALLVTVVSGSALYAVVPLLGWPFVLRKLVKRAANKQRAKFRDTLPGYLQDLASAMRVGRSFVGAISAVADTADQPVRSELERAVTDEALGRPLEESLEGVALRMEAPDMDQVALIASLNRRSGSNVAEALDRVAEGARERADLRREVKALTGQAKMSSLVLTALPGILLAGISLVSAQYAYPLFHTTVGIVMLCVGACMVFAGWKVMGKITTVDA